MVPNYLAYESDRAFPKYNFAFDQLSKYSAFMVPPSSKYRKATRGSSRVNRPSITVLSRG